MSEKRRFVHGPIDECYYDGLDNTAKIIPPITDARNPNVFGYTAVLYEEVVPEALTRAVEKALSIMPAFSLKLNRGLFWYYFDVNNASPKVREARTYPCAPIYKANENGFLFRVTYFHKRINFEIFHALSDGMGALNFMKLIVYCYFIELHGDEVPEELARIEADETVRDFDEDSFAANVPKDAETPQKDKKTEAFRIGGYRYDGTRLGVIGAQMDTDKLLALAKSYGATLSEYMAALLIYSVYNTSYRRSMRTRPIVISIPVNLRGMFESATLRNFFGQMNVSVKPERNASFESILEATKLCFKKQLTRQYFENQMTNNVKIERIPGIRFVPLFIKDAVMRFLYKKGTKYHTLTFSNLGRIQLPEVVSGRVDRFEALIGGSDTHPKKTAMCSYNNKLVLMFSSTVDDNSLEQFLISCLTKQGVEVTISGNETPRPQKDHPNKAEIKAVRSAKKQEKREVKERVKAEKREKKAQNKASEQREALL